MDPWLKEITESTPADRDTRPRLVPEYADPESFAARTPGAATARNVRTALEGTYDDKTFAGKVARLVGKMLLGSPNPPTILDKEGKETVNPAYAMDVAMGFGPGILAGPKGAVNLGGQRLARYKTGEAVAETGIPSQELWRSYGYAKGAEGKGRFEISDVPAQLKEGAQKARTVGEALEHPELFAAYPDLQRIPLRMRIDTLLTQGKYNPVAEMIEAQGLGKEEAKSTLLHELQHAVQRRENFAQGANMKGGREAYEKSAGEIEAYNVQARLANPDLMRMAPELTERHIPRIEQIISQDPAAVMEAVKEPGGMWHPEAVERLGEPLFAKLAEHDTGPLGFRDMAAVARNDIQFKPDSPYTKSKETARWVDRAIRNYLNKYAGTERDPLRDVEVPFGEGTKRWEELTDKAFGKKKVGDEYPSHDQISEAARRNPNEPLYYVRQRGGAEMIDAPELGPQAARSTTMAIEDYLSHVGDYLRQNVDPAKLQQYDLVRAVRETAANDARVAKEMEKAAAASMKDMPVYKEYPDGMKWVELRKPERLTEEQAKGVRAATKEERYDIPGNPGDTAPYLAEKYKDAYIAVDAQGKPIRNSYTGDRVVGRTPEEAHLAGQLAQEGNQMGHCVGGYCEGVASGESRIFSLRDAKGRSHVTVEVAPPDVRAEAYTPVAFYKQAPKEVQERIGFEPKRADPQWESEGDFTRRHRFWRQEIMKSPEYRQWLDEKGSDIVQIKGKQNRAPNAEYLPYVQDFVKSGKWGEVGDLGNTGLRDVNALRGAPNQARLLQERYPNQRFLTEEEMRGFE